MNAFQILKRYRSALEIAQLDEPRELNQGFTLRCIVNDYTGYGNHAHQITSFFRGLGYRVAARPIGDSQSSAAHMLRALIEKDELRPLVALQPPSFDLDSPVDFWYTMHETSMLSAEEVHRLELANALIVPTQWNASCFNAQGIDRPIHVCPLGVDRAVFQYVAMADGPCVFGAAGNASLSVAFRKNLDAAITAFSLAFPVEKDVELRLKVLPDCPIQNVTDPRIKITRAVLTAEELAHWMQSLTAFILPSRCEGWGLYALQAMACGRPVITSLFGGVAEFVNRTNGYDLDYRLTRPKNCFHELGLWAEPSLESLVAQMRRVYSDRHEAENKGLLAATDSDNFTWDKSNEKLESILFSEPLRELKASTGLRRDVRLIRIGREKRDPARYVCGMDNGRGFSSDFAELATYSMRWKEAYVGNPDFRLTQRAKNGWTTDDEGLSRITCQDFADDSDAYYRWLTSLDCLIYIDPRPGTSVYDAMALGIPVIAPIVNGPLKDCVFSYRNEAEFVDVLRWVYMDRPEVEERAQHAERLLNANI